ncbi:MAG: hypothetical protein M1827_000465 [Pycnora praestabilis]|nr:MAG: hypothetical protein M1827_000465 [Pycnora praestabilis]
MHQTEIAQPQQVQQMAAPKATEAPRVSSEQPRPTQSMTAEPMRLRGGGEVALLAVHARRLNASSAARGSAIRDWDETALMTERAADMGMGRKELTA